MTYYIAGLPYSAYLYHHGILGQRWGHKNGPPYPLDAKSHSKSEQKAGWRKSLSADKANSSNNNIGTKDRNQINHDSNRNYDSNTQKGLTKKNRRQLLLLAQLLLLLDYLPMDTIDYVESIVLIIKEMLMSFLKVEQCLIRYHMMQIEHKILICSSLHIESLINISIIRYLMVKCKTFQVQ